MNQKPLFSLTKVPVPDVLLEKVLQAIERKQYMARIWRIRISVALSIGSLVALVPAGKALATSLATSHIGSYLSLFTDSIALSYWKEIAVSVLESLPASALALTIALAGILVWSIRMAIRSISTNTQVQYV